jgi:hypothetical protein
MKGVNLPVILKIVHTKKGNKGSIIAENRKSTPNEKFT